MPKRVLFPVVALLLSALIVALGWQNHQLRQINAQMAAQLQNMRLEAHGLSLGSRPEALALRTTQHTHVNIGGARRTSDPLLLLHHLPLLPGLDATAATDRSSTRPQ